MNQPRPWGGGSSGFTQVADLALKEGLTDPHYSYWLVTWLHGALLQDGSALLELELSYGRFSLDSWSLVDLPSFQNCLRAEQPLGNSKPSIPQAPLWGWHPCCSSDKADGVTQGDRRQRGGGGKEKPYWYQLVLKRDRERKGRRGGERERQKH